MNRALITSINLSHASSFSLSLSPSLSLSHGLYTSRRNLSTARNHSWLALVPPAHSIPIYPIRPLCGSTPTGNNYGTLLIWRANKLVQTPERKWSGKKTGGSFTSPVSSTSLSLSLPLSLFLSLALSLFFFLSVSNPKNELFPVLRIQ